MNNLEKFKFYITTNIPSEIVLYSLLVTAVVISVGLLWQRIRNERDYVLWALLVEYAFIVICSTIVCRGTLYSKFEHIQLSPFWTYRSIIAQTPGVSVWDIVLNVVMFLPLGFLVKLLYPSLSLGKMLLIAVACSLCIETSQYVFEKGIAQIDDVMHNAIGAMIGWGVAKGTLALVKRVTT